MCVDACLSLCGCVCVSLSLSLSLSLSFCAFVVVQTQKASTASATAYILLSARSFLPSVSCQLEQSAVRLQLPENKTPKAKQTRSKNPRLISAWMHPTPKKKGGGQLLSLLYSSLFLFILLYSSLYFSILLFSSLLFSSLLFSSLLFSSLLFFFFPWSCVTYGGCDEKVLEGLWRILEDRVCLAGLERVLAEVVVAATQPSNPF